MIVKIISWIRWVIVKILKIPIYIYKYSISPIIPKACRHNPTCSVYALEALEVHGPIKGLILTAKRISRCHPWGTHGDDPVPPKKIRTKG